MDLTYPEVGATRGGVVLPPGYRHVHRSAVVGTVEADFAAAVAGLRDWRMFRAAGLAVRASAPEVAEGVEFHNGLGIGPLRLWVPCRIVWLEDAPGRFGYGMGTLPGHPASGEEAFVVTRDARGRVWFEVRAFSRPATWYARAGGPATRLLQGWVTGRYLRGMRRVVDQGS